MTFEGINSVELQGELCWPELKYTSTEKALFKAKLRIPTTDQRTGEAGESYLRITAWEEFAEYLNSLPPRSRVHISGRIQERSFTNREQKKQNITEIIVNGAEVADSEEGINRFHLRGQIVWPELQQVGERGTNLFRSKVIIPFYREDDPDRLTLKKAYVRITAWNELAEGLSGMEADSVVDVTGHVQERSWVADNGQKRVFTDAVVTNFVPTGEMANA
jgi:single-stranded DNA-binding protein